MLKDRSNGSGTETLLELVSVTKRYMTSRGVKEVIKDANFSLYRGEFFSILGSNGTGKTTLASLIATLHPVTSGTILWKNQSVFDNLIAYRKVLGLCPQKPNLDSTLTLEENLVFAGRYYGMKHDELYDRIAVLSRELDLTEYLQQRGDMISYGCKQRFSIARALVHRPQLLILDEPTAGLDHYLRRQLWDTIASLKETGITVILVTHNLSEAESLSDRVCILHSGKIGALGSPQYLKSVYQQSTLEGVFLTVTQKDSPVSPLKTKLDV